MLVANELASLYIDANMQLREGQAASTSEFLAKQVEDVRIKLEQQENKVTDYKRQHLGELPEQREANLAMIDALQKQMVLLSDNLARAQERRNTVTQMANLQTDLETELAEVEVPSVAREEANSNLSPSEQLSPEQQLKMLQGQLAQFKMRFSEKHPDIIRLKQLISNLESQVAATAPPLDEIPTVPEEPLVGTVSARATATQVELAALDSEVQRMKAELQKIGSDVVMYQQRIENTPKVEQELLSISRDYNTSRELFATLLKRLDEAKLADKLEQNQKAEKFKILEPAFLPDKPAGSTA